ncbi:MAG TPA: lysophospholipid acyltransferase family protein [Chitinispirillaceae bacterium]|nr:lysophospholipid acyltransferase family protein [Chitinispirillaceae bacterium]
MDRQDSSIKQRSTARGLIAIVWTVFSTIVYGIFCISVSLISRKLGRIIVRMWNLHILAVAGVKIVVTGKEKLDKNKRYVFVSNHQSGLDIPILYNGLSEKICFIAKKELFMIPMFGWGLFLTGHIWIDRSNARKAHSSIERAVQRLKKDNVSLILFPEGTRSKDGKVAQFKQGSFALAQKAGVSVVPIAIKGAMGLLPKHSLFVNPGIVHLEIGDPVEVLPEMSKADMAEKFHQIIRDSVEG